MASPERMRYHAVPNPMAGLGSPAARHVHELEMAGGGVTEGPLGDLHGEEVPIPRRRGSHASGVGSILQNLRSKYVWMMALLGFVGAVALFSFAVIITHPSAFVDDDDDLNDASTRYHASSIAFGSCTSYDLRDLTIWDAAIIPSKPDAWIWTGDFVYLDDSELNCAVFEPSEEWQRSCNCSATWLQQPPYSCHAADPDYAADRWRKGLTDEGYNRFLDYMCPNSFARGYFPPPGHDSTVCPRPIFGIYDDHDFGVNNGNSREPHKREFKTMFLDALGEDADSPRRNTNRGAWTQYTLNRGSRHRQVDVFVLDERYDREPLPCDTSYDYCLHVVLPDTSPAGSAQRAWCQDFVRGGPLGAGSCCRKDEDVFFGWCHRPDAPASPLYRYACDVTFEGFGMKSVHLNAAGELVEPSATDPLDSFRASSFCDVLGKTQRRWLRQAVQASTAALQVFVSGSVLVYDPTPKTCGAYNNGTHTVSVPCRCGGDNLDCYRAAQRDLLHTISTARGCAVVLTGDYHFADIKVVSGGPLQRYATYYNTSALAKPWYQVMASGMSASTAKNVSCAEFRLDPTGLRTHPECAFVTGPNFGRIVLESDVAAHSARLSTVRLQVMSGVEASRVLLEAAIDPATCELLSSLP